MLDVEIRTLEALEVGRSRDLVNRYTDFHTKCVAARLPSFFDITRELNPDAQYGDRQRVVTGAFSGGELVGTVAVEAVTDASIPDRTMEQEERFWSRFSEHDAGVYDALICSLDKTLIGSPVGSLTLHSLAVSPAFRRRGIARSLLYHTIESLDADEQLSLYIEFARLKGLRSLGASLGFSTVRQTFSISERLEYGCWGSVLMRYRLADGA